MNFPQNVYRRGIAFLSTFRGSWAVKGIVGEEKKHSVCRSLIWLLLALFTVACSPAEISKPAVTFYHWETSLAPSPTARQLLDSFACDRLYVKAFDVSFTDGKIRSAAWVEMKDTSGLPELTPVVFITNSVFLNLGDTDPLMMAKDMLHAVEENFGTAFNELQVDCDWTAGTREAYFSFLRGIKIARPDIMLTCTVRLHQYRDRKQQGIPPVDRGTLMAYNTGDLTSWLEVNSIYDSSVVKVYLANQPAYPLNLDLAVAAYDWAAVYRRDLLVHLINEPDLEALQDTARFQQLSAERFLVRKSTYLNGLYLYEGDLLRYEVVRPESIVVQTQLLQNYVKSFTGQRLMVYRIGSRLWEQRDQHINQGSEYQEQDISTD